MASQREIRRRIGAVKNIRQITRAMQFVAASKLKRAQESTIAARPYGHSIDEVIADLAAVLGEEGHALLSKPADGGAKLIVLFTPIAVSPRAQLQPDPLRDEGARERRARNPRRHHWEEGA